MSAAGRRRPGRTTRRLLAAIPFRRVDVDPRRDRQLTRYTAWRSRWPLLAVLPLVVSAAPPVPPPGLGPSPGLGPPPAPARTAATAAATPAAPADLIRSREWSLPALHIPQAWKWSKGAGVTVAVLDTGVDGRHPDLVGRVIQGPDYTGHGRRPGNRYWGRHGTAMASIIAGHGHGPARAAGVVGVAPLAKILSIRVTWENDDPERADRTQVSRTRDAVAKGIRYAVDHGAQIINMSLGGGKMIYNGNAIEEDAVRYALGKGAMLIASAGNDGAGLNRTNFPAAYSGVTAVGAVDRSLRPAKFTNRHDYVSVGAPGVDIISADAGRSYVQGTGTSPSAAIVAGIAALVRSRCPALTPEQTRLALEQGTTHRPPGGRNTKVGAGVTDALKAVYAGNQICKAPPPNPVGKQEPQGAGAAVSAHASLPRIGVLGGGAVLLIFSLFMGWRQRRRRAGETRETREAYNGHDPDDGHELYDRHEPYDGHRSGDRHDLYDRHDPYDRHGSYDRHDSYDRHELRDGRNAHDAYDGEKRAGRADPGGRPPVRALPRRRGRSPTPTPARAPVHEPVPTVDPARPGSVHRAAPPPPRPEPARPEPARPEPARPEPVRTEPVRTEPVRTEPAETAAARPEPAFPGLLAAPVALPDPGEPAPPRAQQRHEFGDDPLGAGYVAPLLEASTPLADESWESVLRGRHRDEPADAGEPGDFLRFESRFRPPPPET